MNKNPDQKANKNTYMQTFLCCYYRVQCGSELPSSQVKREKHLHCSCCQKAVDEAIF